MRTWDKRRAPRTLARMVPVRHIRLADNSVYLLEAGGERLLIDTGPDYRGSREALAAALEGVRPSLVVATHGHLDHAGLGGWWQAQGASVAIHQEDLHYTSGHQLDEGELAALEAYVRGCGAPREIVDEAVATLAARRAWTQMARERGGAYPASGRDHRWPSGLRYEPFAPARLLADAATEVAPGVFAVASPGHTPGNMVVWVPSERWLFSGDQLLPEITPIPAIQSYRAHPGAPWRFRSLPRFLDSLAGIRESGATRCFPGHGEPFDHVNAVIDANLQQAEQRTERVREALIERGGGTVWELAEAIYPRAVRRRFWQIISTIQGHLDVLEEQGRAASDDGRWVVT